MECFFKLNTETTSLADIFENVKLLDKYNKEIPASEVLRTVKYLVVLFMAYENLQDAYKDLTAKLLTIIKRARMLNLRLEIIYVPVDTEEDFMNDHLKEHENWYHMKIDDEHKRVLIERFQIIINPSIVVLSKYGEIISKEGVQDVLLDDVNVLVTWT